MDLQFAPPVCSPHRSGSLLRYFVWLQAKRAVAEFVYEARAQAADHKPLMDDLAHAAAGGV